MDSIWRKPVSTHASSIVVLLASVNSVKSPKLMSCRSSGGRAFHTLGPAAEKLQRAATVGVFFSNVFCNSKASYLFL